MSRERSEDKEFVLTSEPSLMNGGGVFSTLLIEFSDLTDANRGEIKVTGLTIPTYMEGVVELVINEEKVGSWDTSPAGQTGSRIETFDPPLTFSEGTLKVEFSRESWHTVPDLPLIEVFGYVDKQDVDTADTTPWGDS